MDEKDKSKYLGDIQYFSAKLEKDPSSILFIPLAKAYIKLEQFDEAVRVLTEGIDANTEYVAAKTLLAGAYLGQGKSDDAKAILTEVQVIDKNNYLASKLMGDIYRSEDETKKALICYRNALMVAPEDADLRNLVEELMSASGIAAHELDRDISLMEADDEMLDQLGSELAQEVRQEVGEAELGIREASEDEVSKALDEIVGDRSLEDDEEEMSLDSFQQDVGGDSFDELEEEMVASLDDSIIPTDLSEGDAVVSLGDDVMAEAGDGEEPDGDDVKALAAELGADLGLPLGEEPGAEAPAGKPDEVDDALANLFAGVEEQDISEPEGEDTGLSFFDGIEPSEDGEAVIDEGLMDMLSGGEKAPAPVPTDSEDDIAAMLAQVEAEKSGEPVVQAEEPAAEIEPEPEETAAEEPFEVSVSDPEDDIAAMLAQVEAENAAEKTADEAEEDIFAGAEAEDEGIFAGAEAENEDMPALTEAEKQLPAAEDENVPADLMELLDGIQAQDEEASDEPLDVEAMLAETMDEEPHEEPAGEVFEASMDELLESGPEDEQPAEDNDGLDVKTREQVNRLENLLEIIKNNASD